jgi:uncharacterized protein involved in type VI secretion and phage assembly
MQSLAQSPAQLIGQVYLAQVTSVKDPDDIGKVQVRLLSFDGESNQQVKIWARVAAPFAGAGKGAFMLPDVDDEVLVTFVNSDPRFPVVIGSLWNGGAKPPEKLGGDKSRVDRWTVVGKAGTRIAIEEEQGSQPSITMKTPGGVSAEFADTGGGKIEFRAFGNVVTIDSSGVTVESPAKVTVNTSMVEVNAGMVTVNTAMTKVSGVVQCDTLITNSVISASYTPGAGNIW